MHEKDIVILGGGPTGLGAAWRLEECASSDRLSRQQDWILLDASSTIGGAARSITDEKGYTWDLGWHGLYSHYPYFDQVLDTVMGGEWVVGELSSYIWVSGTFVPTPIQKNVRRLPPANVVNCIHGLLDSRLARAEDRPVTNFQSWLMSEFGRGLCELFFFPFNRKMWAHSLESMGTEWTTRRSNSGRANVPQVDLHGLLRNIITKEDDPDSKPLCIKYPAEGGIGTLWRRLGGRLPADRVRLNTPVTAIDADAHTVRLGDGTTIRYRHMVSALPIDRLLTTLGRPDLVTYSRQLKSCGMHAIGFGIRGELPSALESKRYVLFPDAAIPFHRITIVSNNSPANVPCDGPHWSILCEVCTSTERPIDERKIVNDVRDALAMLPFLPPALLIDTVFHTSAPYAYAVPTLGRDDVLHAVQSILRSLDIWSRGRFGGWKYEVGNMDHSFMQGVEAIDNLLFGTDEVTYFTPGTVE